MSYVNITKNIDQYLKQIKKSENRVKDIIAGYKASSAKNLNRSGPSKKYKEIEFEFLKEYINRKIKKHCNLNNSKQSKSSNKNRSFESVNKSVIEPSLGFEYENKGIQTEFLRPHLKKKHDSGEISTADESYPRKSSLPALHPKTPKAYPQRAHSRPKNQPEFMKNYYKYHVKLHFAPRKLSKSNLNSSKNDLTPLNKSFKDFKRVRLFNIAE